MKMELKGKKVVVVGMARSGMAVARFLKSRDAQITITDKASESVLGTFPVEARTLGVDLELGEHRPGTFENADLIVISPGVAHTMPLLQESQQRGIPVIGEVELAARFIQKPILAVSGTNGKTTTTELLGRMLANSGFKVFVGGNIGNPLIEIAERDFDLDFIVAEISSFQLDTIVSFRPQVALLLNITPDHLDRYSGIESYSRSKRRLFLNQGPNDFAVCHGNDPLVQKQCTGIQSRVLNFYACPPENGTSVYGAIITPKQIAVSIPGFFQGRFDLMQTSLIGPHNRENIAAAVLAALAVGGTATGIQKAVDSFEGLAHRIEKVATINNVQFVNDSKATNVDAVMRALECFDQPVVLIMGGRNKGYDFRALKEHVRKHVKKLIVIGEAGDEILAAIGQIPEQGAEKASSLELAVQLAYICAQAGDTVLLSPACSSFDMFGSYAERGEKFCQAVKGLM